MDRRRKAIHSSDWEERAFRNLNSNEMVHVFNATLENILTNFIRHETTFCDDQHPSWITEKVSLMIRIKHTRVIS